MFTYGPLGFLQVPVLYDQSLWALAFLHEAFVHTALAISLVWAARRALPLALALAACYVLLVVTNLEGAVVLVAFVWCFAALGRDRPPFVIPFVVLGGGRAFGDRAPRQAQLRHRGAGVLRRDCRLPSGPAQKHACVRAHHADRAVGHLAAGGPEPLEHSRFRRPRPPGAFRLLRRDGRQRGDVRLAAAGGGWGVRCARRGRFALESGAPDAAPNRGRCPHHPLRLPDLQAELRPAGPRFLGLLRPRAGRGARDRPGTAAKAGRPLCPGRRRSGWSRLWRPSHSRGCQQPRSGARSTSSRTPLLCASRSRRFSTAPSGPVSRRKAGAR